MTDKQRAKAQKLAQAVAAKAGDNLVSIISFGSLARGYAREHTTTNLFIILEDASTSALRPLEADIAEWAKSAPPPLIISRADWQDSTDVFAIEIEDMRDAHEVLAGRDPFEGITTEPDHLRHELERELRGKLLQLRSQYAAVAPNGKKLTFLLLDSIGTFFILMRALVRLTGGKPGADPATLVRQASETAGVDAGAFDWVVKKMAGDTVPALKAYDPVGAAYVDAIEQLARFVDTFDARQPAVTPQD